MMRDEVKLNEMTDKVIGCAFRVSNVMGSGFLEKVYENALAFEVRKPGLEVVQQAEMEVTYDGVVVGECRADLLVEGSVVVELKAAKKLANIDMAQCLNYLKASKLGVCLLLNFGTPKLEIRRVVNSGREGHRG
ncbi:MAG: GxxExxY protein [Planctomycetota bacterium]|jgi:GxxExxY protein